MIRFSLVPARGDVALLEVEAMARQDPAIACLHRERFGLSLVFCPSANSADEEALRFERRRRVSPSLCVLTITPRGVCCVDAMGVDSSVARLEGFVRRMLTELGPFRAVDDETGDDLMVGSSTAVLFAPD